MAPTSIGAKTNALVITDASTWAASTYAIGLNPSSFPMTWGLSSVEKKALDGGVNVDIRTFKLDMNIQVRGAKISTLADYKTFIQILGKWALDSTLTYVFTHNVLTGTDEDEAHSMFTAGTYAAPLTLGVFRGKLSNLRVDGNANNFEVNFDISYGG